MDRRTTDVPSDVPSDPTGVPAGEPTTQAGVPQWADVAAAAHQLGITEGAVRSRVKRGTLESRRESGRLLVRLDVPSGEPCDVPPGEPTTQAGVPPTNQADEPHVETDVPPTNQPDPRDELIAVLRDELEHQREELAHHRQAERELRLIIARLTERIIALPEPAADPASGPTAAGTPTEVYTPRRRPWWRFWEPRG